MSTALTSTTLSAAVSLNASLINVASAAGMYAPQSGGIEQKLYVINPETTKGELMSINPGLNGTAISVTRNSLFRQAFVSGAYVVIGQSPANEAIGLGPSFFEYDPAGAVTAVNVPITPWINVTNGNQWLRSVDGLWVPGFGNRTAGPGVTATVPSFAGVILPSGPLFHVTGAEAVTGFTLPVGFTGGSFSIIPDGTFTWTTAGNIAVAGTAVVSKTLTFTWSSQDGKFYPNYVA
jgi:hypothetical protein